MFVKINAFQMVNVQHIVALTVNDDKIVRVYTIGGDDWIVDQNYSEKLKTAISKYNFYYTK